MSAGTAVKKQQNPHRDSNQQHPKKYGEKS
jgi:hypothetical protein